MQPTIQYNCIVLYCIVLYCIVAIPSFHLLCDDIEIQNLNNSNSMKFRESLLKFEVVTEASKFSNYSDKPDYHLPVLTSCKYYTINEVQKLKCLSI